jgi:lipid II:glycine glycyltransferase (peptidoglycan interpeptide bridge formation enzyme)
MAERVDNHSALAQPDLQPSSGYGVKCAKAAVDEAADPVRQLRIGALPQLAEMPGAGALDAAWDSFVAEHPGDLISQTAGWAAWKESAGWETKRITIRVGSAVVGGAQLLVRRFGRYGAFGMIPRGPMLRRRDRETIETAVDLIEATARAARVTALVVQPPEGGEPIEAMLDERRYLAGSPPIAPTATVRIDLRQSQETILSRMASTRRRSVRRARIMVREGGEADVALFHELHAATAARQGFTPMSLAYLQGQWAALHGDGRLRLLLAVDQEKAVAGIWLTGWDGTQKNLNPNEACQWHAIQWAKANGFRYYDLGGIDRSFAEALQSGEAPSRRLLDSPAAFKRHFGGEVVLLPQPRFKVFNPLARPILRIALAAVRHSRLAAGVVGGLRAG